MKPNFQQRDIIAINDFSKEEVLHILDITDKIKQKKQPDLLRGHILANCFFEPSTRTRLSFESAMQRMGGSVIGFSDSQTTSVKKGESLSDTMKMIEHYADIIVIRHPLEGAAQQAANCSSIPVINAGDGTNQHPTQTLLDLFTINECQNKLEGLNIAMIGDLKYGRTVHSLAQASSFFNHRLYFISPPHLEMPKEICDELRNKRIKFSFHKEIDEIIEKIDILYVTRLQTERFPHHMEYEEVKSNFILKSSQLAKARPNLKILHPLPRVNEIQQDVDHTPFAHFFQQAQNGLFVRQALLGLILGKL